MTSSNKTSPTAPAALITAIPAVEPRKEGSDEAEFEVIIGPGAALSLGIKEVEAGTPEGDVEKRGSNVGVRKGQSGLFVGRLDGIQLGSKVGELGFKLGLLAGIIEGNLLLGRILG